MPIKMPLESTDLPRKHSKGPWTKAGCLVLDADGGRVFMVIGNTVQVHANLTLAAAAPEMRDVIEVLANKLEQATRGTGSNFADLIATARLLMIKADRVI